MTYEPINRDGLLNLRDAAKELGIPYDTFYGRTRRKEYPRPTVLAGGRLYYRPEDIQEIRKLDFQKAELKKQLFRNDQQWELLAKNLKDLRRRASKEKDKDKPCGPLILKWLRDIGEEQANFLATNFPTALVYNRPK